MPEFDGVGLAARFPVFGVSDFGVSGSGVSGKSFGEFSSSATFSTFLDVSGMTFSVFLGPISADFSTFLVATTSTVVFSTFLAAESDFLSTLRPDKSENHSESVVWSIFSLAKFSSRNLSRTANNEPYFLTSVI